MTTTRARGFVLTVLIVLFPAVAVAQTPCQWNETQTTEVSTNCPAIIVTNNTGAELIVTDNSGAGEAIITGNGNLPDTGLRINGDRMWKLGANVANSGPQTFAIVDYGELPAIARFVIAPNGHFGLNTSSPWGGLHLSGAGQAATNPVVQSGAKGHGATLFLQDTGNAPGNGGMVVFGSGTGHFAAIKGAVFDAANNTTGSLVFATRTNTSDATLTERMRVSADGRVSIGTALPNGALHVFQNASDETALWADFDRTVSENGAVSGRAEVVTATMNVAAGIINNAGLTGSHMQAINTGAGRLQNTTGLALYAGNSAGGTVDTAAGAYVSVGGGTITNGYGVMIQDVGATTGYALYQMGANDLNYFAGRIGIGNGNPAMALDVTGSAHVTGNMTVDGNIAAKYQDFAEWVPAREDLAPGTVVVLDPVAHNTVAMSRTAYDTTVAGVVSAQPGIILGAADAAKEQIATTGRVRVRVDARTAPIAIGDLLVTSDTPGTAMKSRPIDVGGAHLHRPGTILGKALEPLAKGEGEILVLLSLQ